MSENLDPRYPAAFQRGGEGAAVPSSLAAPRGPATVDASVSTPTPQPVVAASEAAAPLPVMTELEPEQPNPFISALWVVTIGLIVGSMALVYWANAGQNYGWTGGEIPLEMILRQAAYTVVGPMMTAGFIGVVGLLFWHASAWRRRALAEHTEAIAHG